MIRLIAMIGMVVAVERYVKLDHAVEWNSWKSQVKDRAFVQCAFDLQRAFHHGDEAVNNGQTDAGPVVFRGWVNPLEQAENALVIFGGNADAGILKPEPNRIALQRFR